jgi:hypothetical protein
VIPFHDGAGNIDLNPAFHGENGSGKSNAMGWVEQIVLESHVPSFDGPDAAAIETLKS